jgi:acyl dehydratase
VVTRRHRIDRAADAVARIAPPAAAVDAARATVTARAVAQLAAATGDPTPVPPHDPAAAAVVLAHAAAHGLDLTPAGMARLRARLVAQLAALTPR